MSGQFKIEDKYVVDGVVLSGKITPRETLVRIKNMYMHEQDVIVTGYPKCGSMWVVMTIYAIRMSDNLDLLKQEGFILKQGSFIDPTKALDKVEQNSRPMAVHSHLKYHMLPQEALAKNCKIINMIRDPRDAAVSFYHMYKWDPNLGPWDGPWEEFLQAFMKGEVLYGDYFDMVEDWLKQKDNPNVMFLRYEDYLANPRKTIKDIAKFIDVELNDEQTKVIANVTSFKAFKENPKTLHRWFESKDEHHPFFRRGQAGDWQNFFTKEQAEALEKQCQDFEKKTGFIVH